MKVAVIGTGTIEKVIEVPHLDLGDRKIVYNAFKEKVGGSSLNIALRLRALKINAIPLFPYGNDEAGKKLINHLVSEFNNSLKTLLLPAMPRATSNESIVLISPTGEKCNISKTGMGQNSFDALLNDWLEQNLGQVRAVVIGHIRQEKPRKLVTYQLCKKIRSYNKNIPILFNPGVTQYKIGLKKYSRILSLIDVMQIGIEELLAFMGTNLRNADWISLFEELSMIVPSLIVTLGKSGAIVSNKNKCIYYVPAYKLGNKLQDTTGAGDAFLAGYVYGYLRKKSDAESLNWANRSAAFACLSSGGFSQMPSTRSLSMIDKKFKKARTVEMHSYGEFRKYAKRFKF